MNLRIAYKRLEKHWVVVSFAAQRALGSRFEGRGQAILKEAEWELLAKTLGIEPVNAEGENGVLILRRP